jgi:hypothetical protein
VDDDEDAGVEVGRQSAEHHLHGADAASRADDGGDMGG